MRSPTVPPQLQRLAAQAAHDPDRVLTPLAPLMDTDFLRAAYHQTSTSSAAGIDGGTAQQDAEPLDEPWRDLHERRRRGRSQAAPVERVWIAKDDGGQRPMGKPTCEAKMVQRAVAMLREAIYEPDCSDGSEGLRPGRSPQNALQALRARCLTEGLSGLVEADVRGYCASMDRPQRRDVLRPRVQDGRRGRRMGQGLRAGVWKAGVVHHPDTGVVQGGTIAPGLAHILLHQVHDAWFAQEVQPRRKGRSFLIRFAEDCVMGGARDADARTIMAVRPKRFARDGLTIHPTKTAWMAFRKPAGPSGATPRNGPCDFLGLTHDWALSRRGCWVIKRRTARKRFRRTKKALWRWCRANRHAPWKEQYHMLCLKLRGHLRSYGIPGNCRLLADVLRAAEKAWRDWLSRRSSKRAMGGETFQQLRET